MAMRPIQPLPICPTYCSDTELGENFMDAVHIVTGTAVPLDRSDVDTDQIIPSDWLKQVERTGFEKGLFSEWRDDRDFVLNQEQYAGATILIGGPNFGTGSSREHAVWAIQQYGFQAVISPRFGDIFRNNSTKNGLVPVVVTPEVGEQLLRAVEADPTLELTIDVARRTLEAPAIGLAVEFPLDDSVQHRFLEGLDDIALTLRQADDITAYEATRPAWLPTTA
jgi:3-isopropylmalate/(R)-2-methylmalate dehydratase small subunit